MMTRMLGLVVAAAGCATAARSTAKVSAQAAAIVAMRRTRPLTLIACTFHVGPAFRTRAREAGAATTWRRGSGSSTVSRPCDTDTVQWPARDGKPTPNTGTIGDSRSEEHTSELQSRGHL